MNKVKVAVIDTGVDIYDAEIQEYIQFEKELQIDKHFARHYRLMHDYHGHGTMCIKTILSHCNALEIYPIKIFDRDGKTNSMYLVKALENLLFSDIHIINISASTNNNMVENELKEICQKIYDKGKIMVCAHHNFKDQSDSMPTKFASVIGVQGDERIYQDKDFFYDQFRKIQMHANSKETFVKLKGKVTHFGKNSRAAAVVSGIIAKILRENIKITFSELEEILTQNSCKSIQMPLIEKYTAAKKKLKIAKNLIRIVNENFSKQPLSLDCIEKYSFFNGFTGIGRHNAYDFLVKINEAFGVDIDYRDIFLDELKNIDYIVDKVHKEMTL